MGVVLRPRPRAWAAAHPHPAPVRLGPSASPLATVERGEEAPIAEHREVHGSAHAATSACLPTTPSASRCPAGGSVGINRLHPCSRSYGLESAVYGLLADPHGALLRNEGAGGSNPITSTTTAPRSPGCGAFLVGARSPTIVRVPVRHPGPVDTGERWCCLRSCSRSPAWRSSCCRGLPRSAVPLEIVQPSDRVMVTRLQAPPTDR